MTPTQFAHYVRLKTRTNSSTFSNADIIAFMRQRQDDLAQELIKLDEDILLIPQTFNLVASTTSREYSFPADILSRIKRVEAKLNGTDWVKLEEIDMSTISTPLSSETDITNQFSNEYGMAKFDILRKAITIYSGTIVATTNGGKLWCDTWPTAITHLSSDVDMSVDPSTTTHGIPRSLHRIWATGVIIDYKESREKPIPLNETELAYDRDLNKALNTLKHGNLDREIYLNVKYNNGSQY
jgi:hypothetical protein